MDERYIAAVDLGTSKIALAVARVEGDDVQVIYYDQMPSNGIRNSYVYNPKQVRVPLEQCIRKAESELGIKILQIVVGLPRYYVREESATGEIPRSDVSSSITAEEVDNLKDMALDNYPLNDSNKEVIYGAVAQSFSTDDFYQIVEKDVEGMVSEHLEGNFKVFIGNKSNVSNIDKIFNEIGVAIAGKYFTPDTLAKIVLTNEEMDNGVALLDLGGGVTSVSVYKNGILRHFNAIPFGGESISTDIRIEGGFSQGLAENIKLAYGACMPDKLASLSEKIIRVCYKDSGAEKQLPVRYLSEIITYRAKEIIQAMLYSIQMSGYADELRSGLVITGGGAGLAGISNYIKELSGYNVRIGFPLHKFSASGCAGVGETGAANVIGMVMAAKSDKTLNCLKDAPREEEVEDIAEEMQNEAEEPEQNIEGSVFDLEGWEKTEKPVEKKKKAKVDKKTSGIWKVLGRLTDSVDKTFSTLYDGMEDESSNDRQ